MSRLAFTDPNKAGESSLVLITAATPLPVSANISVETGAEAGTTPIDRSGTITLGGTAQAAMSANSARVEAWIYNVDAAETLWINLTGTAAANSTGSIEVPAKSGWSGKVTSAISIVAVTTGHKFTAGER